MSAEALWNADVAWNPDAPWGGASQDPPPPPEPPPGPPFRIEVFDKTWTRRGWVGDPAALRVTVRHNALGTATLTLASDHRRLADLVAPGARVVITYDGEHLLSGPIRPRRGTRASGMVELDIEDDWRLLPNVLGWPVPGAALTAQTVAYDVRSGPAETVLKSLVTANAVTRQGRPVTVAPDLGRGGTINTSHRMHSLADRLLPALDLAGIGVTVRQSGAGLLVDCYVPAQHPRTLTEASGVVQDWSWSAGAPTATRVVAGAQGEAAARVFHSRVDAAREAEWADVIEVFVDARDTDDPAVVAARMAEVLDDGAPRSGLSVSLAETKTFRYGRTASGGGVLVGDRVRVEVGPGVVVEDVLREATLSWTSGDGLTVTPVIGERTDDPSTVLARTIGALARGVRDLRATR